ncbi:hypothetical protein [Christiangramia sp. OXR-203]|jgi:hypothetical protein|uniref:hypothetical protein n=1 Tax=Christiangramia sp. OXR-203 TaxID=3100176 RepID=UPI002AC90D9A|nr:hypothetical protein [Christiangramia sp. OXR-203]WPY99378.1 hypothetical protein T8I65_04020 [Christiangramia sp. OXR-203]
MDKIYKAFLILFLSSLAVSCSKDSDNDSEEGNNRAANLKVTGSSASDLLSDTEFTSMNIEIVYAEGFRPETDAIDAFRNFLESRVYKPDGITINLRSVASSGLTPFDEDDLRTVETNTRTVYTVGDEIGVWIYFAAGKKINDSETKITLGTAFRNTSIILYGETIKNFASKFNAPSKAIIEAATLNHEFGHLFGLVNLGVEPVTDHEDPNNTAHCITDKCLMKASIEFGSGVINTIDNNNLPQLDDACILDLQSAGGK